LFAPGSWPSGDLTSLEVISGYLW